MVLSFLYYVHFQDRIDAKNLLAEFKEQNLLPGF